ncbi:MAG: hypothetical protein WBS54_14800 [Acidobacteriota bacterium]
MDRAAFDATCQLLTGAGVEIEEARYDEQVFGSWFVSVRIKPGLRMVWEGRDHWLFVQRRGSRLFRGEPVWEDLWVATMAAEQTLADAVARLTEFII